MAGSMAAGLVAMVARLTLPKIKEDGELRQLFTRLLEGADDIRGRLMDLAAADTDAFNRVMAAYRLSKGTPGEKDRRSAAIRGALKEAAEVPLKVMETVSQLLTMAPLAVERGNPATLTDAGVAVQLAGAAVRGAYYNVMVNLGGLKEPGCAEMEAVASDILRRAEMAVDELSGKVAGLLKK